MTTIRKMIEITKANRASDESLRNNKNDGDIQKKEEE